MGVTDFLLLSCLGFAITAYAQDCARPAGGPNMHLKDKYILNDTFSSGDQAAFDCDVGYTSAGGSSSITCTAGSWSTVRLRCDRKNCGSPGELLNGQIRYPKENLFGDHIEMSCDEGYRMVGQSTRVCGADGWLGRMPRCEVMTCDEAPQVKGASFTPYKDPYNFGDVVQYSCQNGLTLNGSASISCSEDGTFKPAPPTCTSVQCEDLDLPNLDWVSGSRPPHKYKATITYRCRTGYKMVGSATLTCEINSKWSPGLPRCEMVTCNPPNLVASGSFNPVKQVYKYGEVVRYSCKTNFRLSGSASARCSDDGTFRPAPPTCIMICNPPPLGANRIVSPRKDVYDYNESVKYSCQTGFKLNGSNSASCSDDATFKPDPPTCTMVTCNRPLPLEHGSFSPDRDSYKYEDKVEFMCQTGFKLSGSKSMSCSDDGTFKPDPPTCTKSESSPNVPTEEPEGPPVGGGKTEAPPAGGDKPGTNVGGIVGGVFGVVLGGGLIYLGLICCGIVPAPFGKKVEKSDQKSNEEKGTKNEEKGTKNEENGTKNEEKESLREGIVLKESPTDNGTERIFYFNEKKSPVGNANV